MYKFTRDHLKHKKGDPYQPESKERENYFKSIGLIKEDGNIPENTNKSKNANGQGGKRGGRKKGTGN